MDNKLILSRLVENALDFLTTAASEVENNPKYSVIHFYSAVELFLKARLLADHWTLVVSKKQDPDWEKFIAGDFQSVTLDEAARKLAKAVRSPLTSEELDAFKTVGMHRNNIVHFYHKDHANEEKGTLFRQAVVKEQLKAWYYLHTILRSRWADVFWKWSEAIGNVDSQLRDLHSFLQVIYDALKKDIEKREASGEIFEDCPSCGFHSQHKSTDLYTLVWSTCLVCGLTEQEREIKIACVDCNDIVKFELEGFASCVSCSKKYKPEDLAKILHDEGAAHLAAKDEGDYSWGIANCSDCDSHHTVVCTPAGEWLSTCCLHEFSDENIHVCEWCSEKNTGDMEASYFTGCNMCEGAGGWYADKD